MACLGNVTERVASELYNIHRDVKNCDFAKKEKL